MYAHMYITTGYIYIYILTINTVINVIINATTIPPVSPPVSAESGLLSLSSLPAYVLKQH